MKNNYKLFQIYLSGKNQRNEIWHRRIDCAYTKKNEIRVNKYNLGLILAEKGKYQNNVFPKISCYL